MLVSRGIFFQKMNEIVESYENAGAKLKGLHDNDRPMFNFFISSSSQVEQSYLLVLTIQVFILGNAEKCYEKIS